MASDDHGKHGFGFIFVVSLAITSAITAFGAASALAVILVRA